LVAPLLKVRRIFRKPLLDAGDSERLFLPLFRWGAKDIFYFPHGSAAIASHAAWNRRKITHYLQFREKIYLSHIVYSY
jgi:hypothetical protein